MPQAYPKHYHPHKNARVGSSRSDVLTPRLIVKYPLFLPKPHPQPFNGKRSIKYALPQPIAR